MENYYKEATAIELNITLLGKLFSTLADVLQMDKDEAHNIFGIIEDDYIFLKSTNWYDLDLDMIREAIAFYIDKYGEDASGSIQNEIKKNDYPQLAVLKFGRIPENAYLCTKFEIPLQDEAI